MATQADYIAEFLSKVEPLIKSTPLYKSLEFTCVAARRGSEWVLVAGKVVLSTKPSPNPSITPLVRLSSLLALSGSTGSEKVNDIVTNLRRGWVFQGLESNYDVRLTPEDGAERYSWNPPRVQFVGRFSNPLDEWSQFSMRGSGPNLSSLLSYDSLQEIDNQLRTSEPRFNGFDALCSKLNLPARRNDYASFELSAELPARFVAVQTKLEERTLEVDIRCVGIRDLIPELMVDWLPKHEFHRVEKWQHPDPKGGLHHVSIALPDEATAAELMLTFPGIEAADTRRYDIVRESTLLRIANLFDPGQTRLTRYLFEEATSNANPFELGIARLLSVAGFVVLWFGKASTDALPDLVAYWRSPLGEEHVVLVECTFKDPTRKLSDLANRGKQLLESTGLASDRFLSVLFTRVDVTEPDFDAAAERGVVLCDGRSLRDLQQKIISSASPLDVYKMLGNR